MLVVGRGLEPSFPSGLQVGGQCTKAVKQTVQSDGLGAADTLVILPRRTGGGWTVLMWFSVGQANGCGGRLVCGGGPGTAQGHPLVGLSGVRSGSQRLMWPYFHGLLYVTLLNALAFPAGLTGVLSCPRKATRAVQCGCSLSSGRRVHPGTQWDRCSGGCALGRPPGPWLPFQLLPGSERFCLGGILCGLRGGGLRIASVPHVQLLGRRRLWLTGGTFNA